MNSVFMKFLSLRPTRSCKLLDIVKKSQRVLFYSSEPVQEPLNLRAKVVNVAIIGAPNSGKSTLINNIVGKKICAASDKVHTTTKMVRAMCFHNNTQIIFVDTPGVITGEEERKFKIPESMMEACRKGLRCADVIGVVHDIANKWTRGSIHKEVLNMLEMVENKPVFLVLNKCDRVKKKPKILDHIPNLTNGLISGVPVPNVRIKNESNGYSKFSDVFIVSAQNSDGVEDIKNYLISNAKESNLHYSPSQWSDQNPETLIEDTVRAKFLDFYEKQIPYLLTTSVEYFEDNIARNKVICSVAVECPSERYVRLVAKRHHKRLEDVKSEAIAALSEVFMKEVILNILVKVKKQNAEDAIAHLV